jgi:hypothetical protein
MMLYQLQCLAVDGKIGWVFSLTQDNTFDPGNEDPHGSQVAVKLFETNAFQLRKYRTEVQMS